MGLCIAVQLQVVAEIHRKVAAVGRRHNKEVYQKKAQGSVADKTDAEYEVDHHKPTSNCIAVKALAKSADMKMDAIPVSRKLFGDCLRRMRPARDVESEGDRVGSTLKETESSSGCGAILH
jgi:hypothetical protein